MDHTATAHVIGRVTDGEAQPAARITGKFWASYGGVALYKDATNPGLIRVTAGGRVGGDKVSRWGQPQKNFLH